MILPNSFEEVSILNKTLILPILTFFQSYNSSIQYALIIISTNDELILVLQIVPLEQQNVQEINIKIKAQNIKPTHRRI
jgi:hypothetical protein